MLKIKRWSRPASIAFSLLFIAIMCFTLLPSPVQIGPLSFGGAGVASATTTLDYQLAPTDNNIIVYKHNNTTWTLAGLNTQVWAGYATSTYMKTGGGFRFTNINIPVGATITNAYLSFYAYATLSGTTVNTYITGDKPASGNSTVFSTLADYQARRGTAAGGANNNLRTTAQVAWDSIGTWTDDNWYNSGNISSIIQEQIQNNWTSGNALAFFWDDHDGRSGAYRQSDYAASVYPKLHIEYSMPLSISTLAATSVATTYATLNGNVTEIVSGGNVTNYGFGWGLTSVTSTPGNVAPSASGYTNYVQVSQNLGTGQSFAYTTLAGNLTSGSLYYYRAGGNNTSGWVWGSEGSFTALALPAIHTDAATLVTSDTATINGEVTFAGGDPPTVTVYWGTSDGGTTSSSWDYSSAPTSPTQPQGVAAFYDNVEELSRNTLYYYSAKATNIVGTTWANTGNFTTAASTILDLSIVPSASNVGFAYKSSGAWTLGLDSTVWAGYSSATYNRGGGGFRFTNVSIPPGATIITSYMSFYAYSTLNAQTVKTYITGDKPTDGDSDAFTTILDYQNRRGTAANGATDNYRTTSQVGWDDASTPVLGTWTDDNWYSSPEIKTIIQEIIDRGAWVSGNDLALFWDDHDLRGEQVANHYRWADYAASAYPKLYVEYAVLTPVTTQKSTVITDFSSTLNGKVENIDDGNVVTYGFGWGTVSHATPADGVTPATCGYAGNWTSGAVNYGAGVEFHYIVPVSSLDKGTVYYYRAAINNTVGWTWGAERSFTTLIAVQTIDTSAADDITSSSATLNGDVSILGSVVSDIEGTSLLKARFPGYHYHGTHNRTYFAYISTVNSGSVYINYYDNDYSIYGVPVLLAINVGTDVHRSPVVHVIPSGTYEGRIIVAWSITTELFIRRSTNIEDISSWETAQTIDNTATNLYYQLVHLGNGNEAIFYMYDSAVNQLDIGYKTTSDGGTTWSARTQVVSFPGKWCYPVVVASGNSVHLAWHYNLSGYFNVYYIYSTDNLVTWRTHAGNITLPAILETSEVVYSHSGTWVEDIQVDGSGSPVIAWVDYVNASTNLAYWAHYHGGAWSIHSTGINTLTMPSAAMAYNSGIFIDPVDTTHVYIGVRTSVSSSDIEEWHITNANLNDAVLTWARVSQITSASPYMNVEARPIVNYDATFKLFYGAVSSWTSPSIWTGMMKTYPFPTGIEGGNVTAVGFVWSPTSHANPQYLAPDVQADYEDNYISGAVNYGVGQTFDSGGNLTGLSPGVYYFRAAGKVIDVWTYGYEDKFLTKPDAPTSLKVASTTSTSADLTWTTGVGAQKTRIRYSTSGYPTDYTGGDGSTEAYFDTGTSTTVTPLSSGQIYYFTAWGYVSGGGLEQYSTLTSQDSDYTLPASPTSLDAKNPGANSIDLEWVKGTGGDKTLVRGKIGSYPGNITDGTQIYFDTGTTTTHSSLACCAGWYYRAWSYDTDSTYYSSGYSQDTESTLCALPTAATSAADSIGNTSATLHGSAAAGSCSLTDTGFVWSATSVPVNPGNVTPASSGYSNNHMLSSTASPFDYGISSLTPGTCYYFRPVSQSSNGYGYGDEVALLTLPDATTALAVSAYDDVSISLTWTPGTGAGNTTVRYKIGSYPGNTTDGSSGYFGTGSSCTINSLAPNTLYYIRVWTQKSACGYTQDSSYYQQLTQYTKPSLPTSFTPTPHCWTIDLEYTLGTGSDYTIVREKAGSYPTDWNDGLLVGNTTEISVTDGGLTPCGATRYYAAWAYSTTTGYYSPTAAQTTSATTNPGLPTVVTDAATAIGNSSATLNGNVTVATCNVNGEGFVYGTTSHSPGNVIPSASGYDSYAPNPWTETGNITVGTYSQSVSLSPGILYHVRAVAHSCDGYSYGDDTTLLTLPGNPSGLTITGHTNNSISISFTKGTNANNTIIKYDTAGYPATYNDGTLGGNVTGTTTTISGLDPNQLYYIRIWSWTTAGGLAEYSSGYAQITGYTSPADITNFTSTAHDGISISLEWTVPTGGDQTKVLGKEGSYPSSPTDVTATVVYLGTGNSVAHSGLIDCMDWYYVAYGYGNISTYYSDNATQFNQGTTCVAPTVITNAATNVEETTATLNGNVTDVGSSNVKYYGFVWGVNSRAAPGGAPNSGLYDSNWISALGNWTAGTFTHNITTLVEGELYYSRFGAKNNSPNWSWGDETLFLTKPLEPTGCSIVQGDTHLELSWTNAASADKTVIVRKEGSYPANRADGLEVYNDTGTYYDDVGLTNAHHYYYRLWSWATEGGLAQFSDAYCDTNGTPQPIPAVTTNTASLVEETTAQLNGVITNDNGGVLEVGFDWGIATGVYTLHWTNVAAYGNDSFLRAIDSLSEGACVYYRAKARNATGWGYGSESIFQTKPDEPTGLADTAHTSASITLGWTNGDGADSVIIRYKTTGYPGNITDGTSAYSGAGVSTVVSLPTTGQVYYFRIWSVSVCEGLTQYSDTYSQHTAYTSPSDPTGLDAHDPTSTSVLLDWTKGTNGDKTLIVAKLDGYPANTGDGTQVYWDTGSSSVHTVPSCNNMFKHWYYRAWSYDSDSGYFSDSYSEDNETTLKDLPVVTNGAGVTGITNTSARLNGELTCDGGATTTVHIYWGDNNGGTVAVNWDNDVNFGATSIGTFYIDLDTLSEGIIYYYRCYSTNSMGSDWADATISFLTVCLPPVGLTATQISTYEIDFTWTPGILGGKTVIQGGIGIAPATADSGFPVYNGYGNSTKFYMNTNCITDTIYFRGWGLCTAQYSGNYTETHIHVNNPCAGGGGNFTGNYTATCDVADCDPPTGLVATLLTPDTVSLTWTPGNATSVTVIKVQVGTPPANPYEGNLLYRGPGNSTVCSIPTDFVGDTLKFRAWTVCCPWIGY